MAEDNSVCQAEEYVGTLEVERKLDKSNGCRLRDQRALKVRDKPEEGRLPTPPPDPQCRRLTREVTSRAVGKLNEEEEEEEDLAAYFSELTASPFEGHSFDYDTPNSASSAMGGTVGPFVEEAFEHLDRLCALTEQILELRDRSSKYFRRVRGLERVKALKNADRRLETVVTNNEELGDFPDEDTGFAESLLDAMLSNCRQDAPSTQRRNERTSARSPSSRQRSRSLALAEQNLSWSVVDQCEPRKRTARNGGPKVSKWTRVKAAFKWERAYTSDLAEIAESSSVTPSTPTTRYLKIPDVATGSWSGSALSPCTSELSSPSTPIGRVSSASSSNEEVFDDAKKSIVSCPDRQLAHTKEDRKKDDPDRYSRSFDHDIPITESADSIESPSEASREKPLIRIISDTNATMRVTSGGVKDPEILPTKRPTPTLTITIPLNEEEIRSLSSPESTSPLPSSTQDSGGSSPQRPKTLRHDISSPREFKRQYSTIEETIISAPKVQRQDSKWNKVRRAFLTNSTFGVPSSPVRIVAAQSLANDGTNHYRAEALKDSQALREKFGAEFHRKLVEWERLKSGSPRVVTARNVRDGLPLNEERLTPEFRKKLQDWKRAKKGRRTGTNIEQQRVGRRRLTDWQLFRSSSKTAESRCHKNQNSIGSGGSCASIGSAGSFDGKQHLCEDFVKRMEAWRRMSEAACRNNEKPKPPANRVAPDIIDETEFLALEKVLLLFGQRTKKEHRENDEKQLNDCFDGDSRFTAASRGVNCGNEVLIRTSVGSYRFEGISREFTRKLYDWERYRGISPRSSTFRLLGPGYTPFAQDLNETTLVKSPNATGRAFHWSLKRSKSDGNVFESGLRDESYALRRSASLQSLISTDKLENDHRMDNLPASDNSQGIKDPSEDTAVEDSEPEAMIVDIEDVIEETASPLERVQPHQTPVYSVAASETTSIAVPLGTVTSSHEPSPVFLIDAVDDDCERWNGRTWNRLEARSSGNSPSPEHLPASEDWREGTKSVDEDEPSWESVREQRDKEDEAPTGWTEKTCCSDSDSVKFDRPIAGQNRDAWDELGEISERYAEEANRHSTELESPFSIYESSIDKNDAKKQPFENNSAETVQFAKICETSSTNWSAKELMDSPRTCKRMNETGRIEDLADQSKNESESKVEPRQDDEDDDRSRKTMISEDSQRLSRTPSQSNCRNSPGETSLNLSSLNLDDNKDTPECRDADNKSETLARYENCSLPDLQTDVDRHYEILTFKSNTCNDAIDNCFLYEPIGCYENKNSSRDNENGRAKESLSLSRLSGSKKSNLLETAANNLTDSTVRTIPMTVSADNKARCLEKILINEETLNKIIVPTACAESGTRIAEKHRDFANPDHTDAGAIVDDRQRDDTPNDHQAALVEKDGASSRNVFVKTKRMIFGPFCRSEDRPSLRKESRSVDGRFLRSKSKSKSRSTSPKLCRQDALLRVSLSLPWPLRSTSNDSEGTSESESRRSSGSKAEDAVTMPRRNSSCRESISEECGSADNVRLNDRLINEELSCAEINRLKACRSETRSASATTNTRSLIGKLSSSRISERLTTIDRDRSARRVQDEDKIDGISCERTLVKGERDEGTYGRMQQDEAKLNDMECDVRREERRQQQQQENRSPKNDSVPSDLMHKLRILSDAAARREGRPMGTEAFAVSSSESRSSRIRRAKENFLSRRGGPFCRSTMEPAEAASEPRNDPWSFGASTSHPPLIVEAICSSQIAAASEETGEIGTSTTIERDKIASPNEDRIDESQNDHEADVGLRADLVKSASVGMINVDPNTYDRLVATDRGCESLPRAIAKRRDLAGPLAKIVGKLKFSRLIRAKNVDGGNMSTISTLCRQSLMLDMRNNSSENRRPSNERQAENDPAKVTGDKSKNIDDS